MRSHKVLRRVEVDWSGQKGYCFAKVGVDGEEIDGEKKRWRWLLGMREG